jgi:hypothetical protein
VEEVILSQDGKIEQAIVDVGGFLGVGEHRVAFDEMQVMTNADDSEVRISSTKPGSREAAGISTVAISTSQTGGVRALRRSRSA